MAGSIFKPALIVVDLQEDFCPPVSQPARSGPALEAGAEGHRLAEEIGDHFISRMCRFWGIGTARLVRGELTAAAAQFRELVTEAQAAHDPFGQLAALAQLGYNGYVSVEWEKYWHPEIPDAEIALPQHIAWLKRLPYFS